MCIISCSRPITQTLTVKTPSPHLQQRGMSRLGNMKNDTIRCTPPPLRPHLQQRAWYVGMSRLGNMKNYTIRWIFEFRKKNHYQHARVRIRSMFGLGRIMLELGRATSVMCIREPL